MGSLTKTCLLSAAAHPEGITRRSCVNCHTVYQRLYRRKPRSKTLQKNRNLWLRNHPGYRAKMEVYKAVRRGDLPRASIFNCIDCSRPAACYDHRDYAQPLAVEPVCCSCNALRGPALRPKL